MHNKFIRIAIAAVVALLLAVWAGSTREPAQTLGSGDPLVPGLADGINEVRMLKITGAGNLPIATLNRGEGGWTVAEKNGHPADVAKIREFLLKLADATIVEAKTSDPNNYPKLGVEEVSATEAKGALVEIEGLKAPVHLIVGNFNARGAEGTYVRRADEAQSLLAKGSFAVDKVAANWLVRDIADIASTRVREVAIESQGKTLRVAKDQPEDPNYRVLDVPRGREQASEFVANGLASVLSGLRFDDVLPLAGAEPGEARTWKSTYTMFDGLVVEATAWEVDGKDYARFGARIDEAAATASIEAAQAAEVARYESGKAEVEAANKAALENDPKADQVPLPETPLAVSDAAKDREQRLAALRKEAEDFTARTKDWTYVIPAFKFANMNKTLDDMLKPPAR
ncbi:MAG: DUF4340 domain-containing protein [Xanthomonadaceae bacterium]|nr:DUF4340 domain-containing protein [Xanthomonadaceae bacterium]